MAVFAVVGVPTTPEPALNQGFGLERVIYTMEGERADPARPAPEHPLCRRADRHRDPASRYGRLLLVDPVPAGLRDRERQPDGGRLGRPGSTG